MYGIVWKILTFPAAVDFEGYIEWMLAVMVTIFISGIILMRMRRRMVESDGALEKQAGFSIEALEEMRSRGEIGENEFKVLRRAALGLDAGDKDVDNAASSGGGGMSMNDEV